MNDSFVFYASFLEAADALPDEQRLKFYDAVCRYAITGEEPELEGIIRPLFALIKPQVDANGRKREVGKKGGRPVKTPIDKKINETIGFENENQWFPEEETEVIDNENQWFPNEKPNANANANANVNANANANAEQEGISEPAVPHPHAPRAARETSMQLFDRVYASGDSFGEELENAARDWIRYKQERREPYKPTGMTAFINKLRQASRTHGEAAVTDAIQTAISSGYKGIVWDRINGRASPSAADVFLQIAEGGIA